MSSLKNELEIKQYRIGFLLVILIYLPYGLISEHILGFKNDGFFVRLPIAIACFLVLIGSYKVLLIRKIFRYIYLITACILTYQYFGFFKVSNEHFYYTIGIAITPVITAVLFFYTIDMVIFSGVVILIIILVVESMTAVYMVTYLTMLSTILIVYSVVTQNRKLLTAELNSKLEELINKQTEIDEKNKSLIKIGELATQVAHDIRSPVLALHAVSQALSDKTNPKQKSLIEKATKRINDIANNLVCNYRENLTKDLSEVRIDRSITINSLIEDIIEEKKLSTDSEIQFKLKGTSNISLPQNFNSIEFQRVISNLVNNSIEALDKDYKFIDIEINEKENQITISIRDSGKGISKELLSTIFKKGFSRKIQGAGLGLAHAKEYIESIGGKITVDSIEGQETKVQLFMPR